MVLPITSTGVWILALVALLCLGSWANMLKLGGRWRFEYFYYDFVLGILLTAGAAVLLLGSARPQDLTFQDNMLLSGYRKMAWAVGSGLALNLGTTLLLASMSIGGMSVAFPVSLGLALAIGAVWDYVNTVQANAAATFVGVCLLMAGVIVAILAHRRRARVMREASQKALTPDPRVKTKRPKPAGAPLMIILAVVGGIALSTFPRILGMATSGENGLAPYSAIILLAASAFISAPFFVLFFTTFPVTGSPGSIGGYFAGNIRQHLLGIVGGVLWGVGMLSSLLVAAAPANLQLNTLAQYPMLNGAVVIAPLWGLLAWREFDGAGQRGHMLVAGMVVLFLAGLTMVAFAFSTAR
jgi:glucose uptake protein